MLPGNQDLGCQCFRGCGVGAAVRRGSDAAGIWRAEPRDAKKTPRLGWPHSRETTALRCLPGLNHSSTTLPGGDRPGHPSVPPRGQAGHPTCGLWARSGRPGPGMAGFVVGRAGLWEAGRLLRRQLVGPGVWGEVLGPPCPWLVTQDHCRPPSRAALETSSWLWGAPP